MNDPNTPPNDNKKIGMTVEQQRKAQIKLQKQHAETVEKARLARLEEEAKKAEPVQETAPLAEQSPSFLHKIWKKIASLWRR
jgi:hypothetical protein